jgi:integrase
VTWRAARSSRIPSAAHGSALSSPRASPAVTFHALRHTHASMLINAGVNIIAISRRLGHSKAAMTLDVYGHLISGADEAAAAAIEGVLK